VCSVNDSLLIILAVIVVVSLASVVLTRLWVHQIGLRLEEGLELDSRLVPLRKALTVLRDSVALAHSIAKELETLRRLREEASTVLVEIQTVRDQCAGAYNQALEDVSTHRATLNELVDQFNDTYQRLDEAYLRPLIMTVVRRLDIETAGDRLVEHLEVNGFRVNARLRALIADYYNAQSTIWSGANAERREAFE